VSEAELQARKGALRAVVRDRRDRLAPEWVAGASARLGERLLALPEIRAARVVMGYLALPGEASVDAVLHALQAANVRVCVPAAHGTPREYDPAWLAADTAVVNGPWGVREPAEPDWAAGGTLDVVLVPGVAFDVRGGRLGHGKGYYDRMLARLGRRVAWRLGVAFEFQMAEAVPCGPRDERVDAVVSEAGVYRPVDAARETRETR
jgi:5-formyltetrahydrofolate cyclo-ligase